MNRSEKRDLAIVLALAFLTSLAWCLTKGREIEGDDAVMGLMALKISQGEEFPIFFWHAHYSGPIASYLAAPLHWFFEPSPLVLHCVIIPIHMFYCTGMYFLARAWLGHRDAIIVGLFAALPGRLFPYSALGGFSESMAFAPWIFLLCLGAREEDKSEPSRFFFGGFLCGFALWVFPLALPTVLACLICQYKAYGGKSLKPSLVGCLLGLLPTIYYNVSQPGATFFRLLARPGAVDQQAFSQIVSSEGIIFFVSHFLEKWALASSQALLLVPRFTLSLFGLEAGVAAWGHISGAIAFLAFLFGLWAFFRHQEKVKMIPLALVWTVLITYCFLVIFGLNRDRYLIPVLLIVPFGLALGIQRLSIFSSWRAGAIAVASILLINCLANFSDNRPRYPDYQGLARFLESKMLTRGYAPYVVAYPLVYLSNERLTYSPVFHERQYDRNEKYTDMVSRAGNPAYIFNDDREAQSFIERFKRSSVDAPEYRWGNFRIIYGLNP